MALTNRNNRSTHTEYKSIKLSLKMHADLMARYVVEGYSQKAASKAAMDDLMKYYKGVN